MSRLHNLINHNTNLSDTCLRTLEHNSFQICRKLSESKSFKHQCMGYINSYHNIIINTFLSELKVIKCLNSQIFKNENVSIYIELCEFNSTAVKPSLIFFE